MSARKPKAAPPTKRKRSPEPAPTPPVKRNGVTYVPSDQDRRTVESMSRWNQGPEEIARVVGISPTTLRKHFSQELGTAFLRAQDMMWRSLFNQGLGSPARKADKAKGIPGSPAIPPNVKATIAWLEFKAGASARVTVIDGGSEVDPSALSDTEIADRLAKLKRSPAVQRAAKATTVH